MASRCVRIRIADKRSIRPVTPAAKCLQREETSKRPKSPASAFNFTLNEGEAFCEDFLESPTTPIFSSCEHLRMWLQKQRFFPPDLSDDFLSFFLTACDCNLELAKEKLRLYFISRQEPSALFRDRDPLSSENVNILKNLYVLPIPETTADGKKVIITGAVRPQLKYNQADHAKALAMVFDLLIWEKDFGFGDYVIVFDGRGFKCPQLLENKVRNYRSIRSLLQDTIPGRLRSFYFLYPPPHVAKVAESRNGLWVTVVNSKQEMLTYLPATSLPLEYGGNLGTLADLLEQWDEHLIRNREFFIEFEKRMTTYYERRLCHEEEIKKWGKKWVQNMKLFEDEWEYKKNYYARMKCMTPLKHPAFGSQRLLNVTNRTGSSMELKGPCHISPDNNDAFKPATPPKEFEEANPAKSVTEKKESGHCIVLPVLELQTFSEEGDGGFPEEPLPEVQARLQAEMAARAKEDAEPKPKEEHEPETRSKTDAPGRGAQPPQGDMPVEEEEEEKSESEPEIDFEKELIEFNHWLAREPYLPKNIDEEILITFLWDAQSVEQAEAKLMNYYYMRQSLHSVFRDRHPCSPNNLLKYDAVCVIPLTCGTDKKWIIFATWLSHNDPGKFSIYHMVKLIFTELDILLQENQIRGKRISVIIDMSAFSVVHTEMITKFAAKRICHLFTDSFPAVFNGFYILNAPEHVADYTSLFQPLDFHIVESKSDLPGFLPKKYLPSDMGGEPDAPTRDSLFEPFFKRMQRCGNWLAYEELVRSQEMMLRMTTKREDFVYGPIK